MRTKSVLLSLCALGIALLMLNASAGPAYAATGDPWTVGNTAQSWYDNQSSENDVRVTINPIDNSLRLLGENAVGCWSMDEFPSGFGSTENTVYDLTSYVNDGTAENGPTITSGKWDNALDFDGSDDSVSTGLTQDFSGQSFTITSWVKPDNFTNSNLPGIVSGRWGGDVDSQFSLDIDDSTSEFEFQVYDGAVNSIASSVSPSTDTWYFVVGVWNTSTGQGELYVDASSQGTFSAGTLTSSTENIDIGVRNNEAGITGPFDGTIDEVRIYDRALSDNEIQRIYNRTKPDNLAGDDLKTGTWSSAIWDSGGQNQFENIEYSATIGTNENVYWNVEATDSSENTGWTLDEDGALTSSEVSTVPTGENFQVSIKLTTDNTVSSPSISDWTLNVVLAGDFYISSVSVDNSVIDREKDLSWSDPQLSTQVTIEATDRIAGENASDIADNARIDIFDAEGNEVVTDSEAVSTSIVSENVKRFTFPAYNPSNSLADGNLGGFDVFAEAWTNTGSYDNDSSADLFDVQDYDNTVVPNQENLPGHEQRIHGTATLLGGGTASLDNAKRIDNDVGENWASVSGADFENTYKPTGDGSVYFELEGESGRVDGRTDNLNYPYPNIPPTIDSYSSSESLIDKDIDFTGSGAIEKTDLTITVTDNDNRSELDNATLIVRDNSDTQVYEENLYSSSSIVDENTVKYTITYDALDNTTSFGSYDFYGEVYDNYGGSDSGWNIATFDVSDITTTFTFDPTNPYVGWDVTASGTASREYGSGTLDNAWLIDNLHGTFDLGGGNSWSKTYTVADAGIDENIGVEVQMKDPPLDGLSTTTYKTNENQKFQVELYWENSGDLIENSSGGTWIDNLDHDFEIKFWYGKGNVQTTDRIPLEYSVENIIVNCQGEETFLSRVYDNLPKDYWRARVPRAQGGELPFLMVHGGENIFQYKFKLKDYTGEFDNGYVRFYTGHGIVNEDWWDASANSYAYLKLHGYYAARLFSADGSAEMDIRHFQAEADLTPDPFIAATIEQAENMAYRYETITDYAYRDNTGDIRAQWSSKDDNTKLVNIKVWDSRMKDNLLENVSYAHPTDILFQYTEADNSSYWVEITTEHPKYGTFTDSFPISPVIQPVPYSPTSIPSLDLPIPLASLGGFFMVAIVGMMFYAGESGNAMLAIAMMVSFLALIGTYAKIQLMPISITLIGFVWAVAIMWKLSEGS